LHHKNGKLDGDVELTYVTNNEARSVSASKAVWAGYHSILPYVCPDVPEEQVEAQSRSVRSPLVYTNVLIRNWRSFADQGIWRAYCPGSFFQSVRVNRPVSIGDYHYPQSPDEPNIVHLQHIPLEAGLSAPDQFRSGRRGLLETPFETFERKVRDQLGRMLGPGGFDPARDIAGITVNRWSHGYAYSVDEESGEVAWWPSRWPKDERPWVAASQRIGNIVIAGTDASSNAMTESAIEEAHRAVSSLGRD
jgi:spermidine dehydrogenase